MLPSCTPPPIIRHSAAAGAETTSSATWERRFSPGLRGSHGQANLTRSGQRRGDPPKERGRHPHHHAAGVRGMDSPTGIVPDARHATRGTCLGGNPAGVNLPTNHKETGCAHATMQYTTQSQVTVGGKRPRSGRPKPPTRPNAHGAKSHSEAVWGGWMTTSRVRVPHPPKRMFQSFRSLPVPAPPRRSLIL